jgi:hypothetical protein
VSVTFYGKSASGGSLGLEYEHPAHLNFNIGNAAAVLALLQLPDDRGYGTCTMPEARRAIMQARARFERNAPPLTRSTTDTKKPGRARVISGGIDEQGLKDRLDRFEEFVNTMDRMGADTLYWG